MCLVSIFEKNKEGIKECQGMGPTELNRAVKKDLFEGKTLSRDLKEVQRTQREPAMLALLPP